MSPEAIQTFKKIYQEEYGKEISDVEALNLARNLLSAFSSVYKSIKVEWDREYIQKYEIKR